MSSQAGEAVGRIRPASLRHAIALLGEAENLFAPGIGQQDDVEGDTVVRQVIQELEFTIKFGNLPPDVNQGRVDAVRTLENEVSGSRAARRGSAPSEAAPSLHALRPPSDDDRVAGGSLPGLDPTHKGRQSAGGRG